jgi:hypothetical protein
VCRTRPWVRLPALIFAGFALSSSARSCLLVFCMFSSATSLDTHWLASCPRLGFKVRRGRHDLTTARACLPRLTFEPGCLLSSTPSTTPALSESSRNGVSSIKRELWAVLRSLVPPCQLSLRVMTSSSTSSSRARVEHYPADLTEHSYPTTASDRVNAYTAALSSHIGPTNRVPPPNIICLPVLSASHLSTPSGQPDSDHISVLNARKRTAEDAGMDDVDNMGSEFEDKDKGADVLALDQEHEAVLEIDGEEVCFLNNASKHCTHG